MARKRFPGDTVLDAIEKLLEVSEVNLGVGTNSPTKVPLFPQITKTERKIDEMKQAYGAPGRRKLGNSYCLDYKNFPVEGRKGRAGAKGKSDRKKGGKEGDSSEEDE